MANLGIDLEELMDLLSRGHEAVFSLDGKEYIIQTEADEAEQNDLECISASQRLNIFARFLTASASAVSRVISSKSCLS